MTVPAKGKNSSKAPGGGGRPTFLRKRLVERARFLAGDQNYQRAIDQVQRAWNERHPGILLPGDYDADASPSYPPQWLQFLETIKQHGYPEKQIEAVSMLADWRALISDIAKEFWPASNFPIRQVRHPAFNFVSACLRSPSYSWNPELVRIHELVPESTPGDPAKVAVAVDFALADISRLLDYHQGDIPRLELEVIAGWLEETAKPTGPNPGEYPRESFYLPLFEGMTGDDFDHAKANVMDLMSRVSGNWLHARIWEIHTSDPNLTQEQIANVLGIDQKSVSRYLKRAPLNNSDYSTSREVE